MAKRRSDEFPGTQEKNGEVPSAVSGSKGPGFSIKKPKLAFSINRKPNPESKTIQSKDLKVKESLKAAFNSDSDEEEMPKEARMKMRNIGRDTPTSAGPKSFGKTKQGFCDAKRVFEKSLKEAAENLDDA